MQAETLIEKIKSLSPERISQVEDFVDFLAQRNNGAARRAAIPAYAAEQAGPDVDHNVETKAAALAPG